jgi:hypothetical protein
MVNNTGNKMTASKISIRPTQDPRRHGGPYDRGSADSWYGREPKPHYFTGDTYFSTEIKEVDMSEDEIADYMQGYNETVFAQKNYGEME